MVSDLIFHCQKKEIFLEKEGKYKRAPELVGTQKWINSDPLKIKNLIGNVVLIDFCLPYLSYINLKYYI